MKGIAAKADRFADLSGYTFRQRLTIRAADLGFYALVGVFGRAARFEVAGWEHYDAATAGGPPIYAFWHDSIVLATYFWRNRDIVVMTSQSFDGEYIARFIQRFGFGAARGSSTRGGVGALVELIRLVRAGRPAAFTADGPKGPRHVVKMGPLLLAKKTGRPVMPFAVTPARGWEARRSWDRLQIPGLFTRARVEIAAPVFVPPDAGDAELEARRADVQRALDDLEARGQAWRAARGGAPAVPIGAKPAA